MTRPTSRSSRKKRRESGSARESSSSERGSRRTSGRSRRRSRSDPEPATEDTSSRSRRSRRGQQEESSGRSRRSSGRSTTKEVDKRLIYGGAGGAVLLIIVLIAVLSVGDNETSSRRGRGITRTATHTTYNPPSVTPYSSKGEARRALAQAHSLFDRGARTSGNARNDNYRKAKHICERVLSTNSAGSLHQDAGTLLYNANKAQTIE